MNIFRELKHTVDLLSHSVYIYIMYLQSIRLIRLYDLARPTDSFDWPIDIYIEEV
jgi:hypothetical protein